MATTSDRLASFTASPGAPSLPHAAISAWHPRRISPEAGRGIEMLGHAIDYLGDEFALDCISGEMTADSGIVAGIPPQVLAIELLKELNREIYYSCPEVPTLSERLRSWLHWR
jgi:hypothetical protein